jgi:hypothetical protein
MELKRYKYLMIVGIGARSSDWILMNLAPFDSSHRDKSNGVCFISLASILMELKRYKCLTIIDIGARSSDQICVNLLPLESSHQDESNDSKIVQNGLLDAELLIIKVFRYNSAKIKVNSGQIFS